MLKKRGIPIIFFHVGDKQFIDIALRQATLAVPDSDVILLTDEIRPLPFAVHQILIDDYRQSADAFRKSYIHVSPNPVDFELGCFLRWFVTRDFVRRHKIGPFCVFDTDIMLFAPVEGFAAEFAGYAAGNWAWANCFADAGALDVLCDFFLRVFGKRDLFMQLAMKPVEKFGQPHLSDMLLMAELAAEDPRFLDQRGFPAKGYDDNIRLHSEEIFAMNGPIKYLAIGADGVPVARRRADNAPVSFRFVHFQGPAKVLMERVAWKAPPPGKEWLLQPPQGLPGV